MTLALVASPAAQSSTTTTVSTNSFTPPAGSLMVALVAVGNPSNTATTTTGAVTDSAGTTWTLKKRQNSANGTGAAEVWMADAGSVPAARQITLTGSKAGVLLSVVLFTGAQPVASQTGSTAGSTATANTLAITPTATGSFIVGANSDTSTGYTMGAATGSTVIAAFNDTTNGCAYGTWRSTSTNGDTSSQTYGVTPTPGNETEKVAVEILASPPPSFGITPSPAAQANSTTTISTNIFTPPAGSLMVALVGVGNPAHAATATTGAVTDTNGATWTLKKRQNSTGGTGAAEVWMADAGTSPVPMQVTLTGSKAGVSLAVVLFAGAQPAAAQTGATAGSASTNANTLAITPTVTGSYIVGAASDSRADYTMVAAASTTLIAAYDDATNVGAYGSWRSTSTTTSTASQTYGVTPAPSNETEKAAVEILPYPPVSGLTDNFTTQDATKWGGWAAGQVDWLSSTKQVQVTPLPGYYALYSSGTYTLANSAAYAQLVQAPNVGNGSTEAWFQLSDVTGTNNVFGIGVTNGSLGLREQIAGTYSDLWITYNATSMKWFRIRHDGTNVNWETSPDGATWTVQRSKAPAIPITSVGVRLVAGYWGTEPSPGVAIFDNVNVAPGSVAAAPLTGAGTLAATTSVSGGLRLDASSPVLATQNNGATPTLTTASFTPPSGALLVAMWSSNTTAASDPAAPSIAGGGLTWTLRQWKHRSDGVAPTVDAETAVWTAPATTSAAMAVTVTNGAGANHNEAGLQVLVFTDGNGTPGVGTSGKASSTGAATIAQGYTATASGSWGLLSVTDWDSLTGTPSGGTGTSLVSSARAGSTSFVSLSTYRRTTPDGTLGSTTTLNATLPGTSTNLGWAWVEIVPATVPVAGRVQRSGTGLTLNGSPYRLTGFNMWRAAITSWNHPANYDGYEQNTGSNLANDLAHVQATAPHVNAIRVWFVQQFALNGGVQDWTALDKVLSVAAAAGVKVIASLQDNWNYEYDGTQGGLSATWFSTTYSSGITNATYEKTSYRQWVTDVVTRYKNDPRIVMWELGNEMDNMTTAFASDVSSLIKSIDPGALVETGWAVAAPSAILNLSTVDVASFHYYTDYNQINYAATANAASTAGKPTIIGEAGYSTTGATRASSYSSLLSGVYGTAGIVGFLAWQWNGTGGGDQFNISTGDPMLPVLDSYYQAGASAASAALTGSGTLSVSTSQGGGGATQSDTFTGSNGAAPSAANWIVTPSTGSSATIQNNALSLVTGTAGAYNDSIKLTSTMAAAADVEVTLDVTPASATVEAYLDIMLRAPGTAGTLHQAGYKFEVGNGGSASIQKVTNYSGTVLGASVNVSGFGAGVTVHMDAKVSGSTLSLWAWTGATKPGTPTIQVTDTTYTAAGQVGFYLNGGNAAASSATWTADNWTATVGGGGGTSQTTSAAFSGTGTLSANATATQGGGGGGGTPTVTPGPGTTVSVNAPERGAFLYTETHYNSSNGGYVPLDGNAVASAVAAGQTQVFRYFYLEKYLSQDGIDAAYLALVDTDLATIRANGAKGIIRFAYSNTDIETYPYGNPDPGVTRSTLHIQQLAPTINKYADVIEMVEAGFIGIWGEWYYTVNYSAGTDPNVLSAQNWTDRKAILTALLSNLDARIFIGVRYAGIKPNYFGSTTIPADSTQAGYWQRMGYHDDALGATTDDWGTFITFPWSGWSDPLNNSKAFVASDTATYPLPWGGEIGSNNVTYAAFKAEMSQFHANFWNPSDFGGSQSAQGWTAANQTELRQLLGHRLRLVSSSVVTSVSASAATTVSVTIANDGWGSPLRQFPVWVDFVPTGGGAATSTQIASADPRTWKPGGSYTISGTVTAPSTAGTYTVHVRITDPSSGLASRAAYCLPLVNTGTYDATTGRNALGVTVTVTAGGAPSYTASAGLTGSGALTATASGGGTPPGVAPRAGLRMRAATNATLRADIALRAGSPSVAPLLTATAPFGGAGALAVTAVTGASVQAAFLGAGTLTAAASGAGGGAVTPPRTGLRTRAGTDTTLRTNVGLQAGVLLPPSNVAAAGLSGSGALTATITPRMTRSAALTGTGSLVALNAGSATLPRSTAYRVVSGAWQPATVARL